MVTVEQAQLILPEMDETERAFNKWVHTEKGRRVAFLFIGIAVGLANSGKLVGAKAIWERIRWHYGVKRADGERYSLSNNFHSYMARFAMAKRPEVLGKCKKYPDGYFKLRALKLERTRKKRTRWAVIVDGKEEG